MRIGARNIRIIDCHTHHHPMKAAGKLTAFLRDGSAAAESLRIERPADPSTTGYFQAAERFNLVASVNLPVANYDKTPEQVARMNDWAKELMDNNPGRVFSLAAINPHLPFNIIAAELERIRSFGFLGVKLHPMADSMGWKFQKFDPIDEQWLPFYELLNVHGWTIFWHCGGVTLDDRVYNATPPKLARINEMFPKLRQVAAHLGGWQWRETTKHLAEREHVFFDLAYCHPLIQTPEVMKEIVMALGSERIMWGTDFPYMSLENSIAGFSRLITLLTPEEIEAIFFHNAVRIFNLPIE